MSVAVELADLRKRVAEYGPVALVVSVGDDSRPHVVSVAVEFDGRALIAEVGRTTAANAGSHPAVTVVWPPSDGGDYCLIVDGAASIAHGDAQPELAVEPVRAVLHRVAGAADTNPSCITILDQRP